MHDLVFVMYNLKMKNKHNLKMKNKQLKKGSSCQQLFQFDDIILDDKWIIEKEDEFPPSFNNWLNILHRTTQSKGTEELESEDNIIIDEEQANTSHNDYIGSNDCDPLNIHEQNITHDANDEDLGGDDFIDDECMNISANDNITNFDYVD